MESHGLFKLDINDDDETDQVIIKPKNKRHCKPELFQVQSLQPQWFTSSSHPLDKYDNFKLNRTLYSVYYLYYKKEYTKALQILSDKLEANVKNHSVLELTCKCLIKLHRYTEALELWNSHISRNAKEPFILFFTGQLHLLNGSVKPALDYFIRYLELRRDDVEGWKQIHYIFVKCAELESPLSKDSSPQDYLLWAAYAGKKAILLRVKSEYWMVKSVLPCKLDLVFHISLDKCLNSLDIAIDTTLKDLPTPVLDCLDPLVSSPSQKEYLNQHLLEFYKVKN